MPACQSAARRGRLPAKLLAGLMLCLGVGHLAWAQDSSAPPSKVTWSYSGERGPEHWAKLTPDYAACAAGRLQSPIDIHKVDRIPYSPLIFRYRSQSLELVNDGNGVRLLVPPGSELRLRGDVYPLTEVQFHVPGEHRVNGVGSAAEMHFIHRDRLGRPVIVAVRIHAGIRFNSIFARLVDHLPMVPGGRVSLARVGVNPIFLLPSERDYFTYTGSLGSPPCSEPVLWFVLARPVEIDADLIRVIARATGPNARPVQPLNGRVVYFAPRD